ncbi:MAG: hypothetical protein QOF12_2613 [Solirubrobacteraceae bacterium]|nr:hypothetical protein [Solirubrobacteraceae bacterium]
MKKRTLLLCAVLAGTLALVPTAQAGQGAGGCQLDGTANFSKGLSTTAQNFNYDFGGTLSSCAGSYSDKSATVSAGQPITIAGVAYRPLDQPTGNGSCASSTTAGTAFVQWDNGTFSAIKYSTTGYAALVALTGSFLTGSVTLTSVAVDPLTGLPVSTRIVSLAYGGDYAGGPVAFEPPDPTACTGAGVTSAGIQGFIGHGNYQ